MLRLLQSTTIRLSSTTSIPSPVFFFFNDTATTEIYTLSLHDALPILGQVGVRSLHAVLQLDRAGDRVYGAGELDQHPVAHHLDDTRMIFDDERLEDFLASLRERSQRAGLVELHQSAVADDVRDKDGGEATLHCRLPKQQQLRFS